MYSCITEGYFAFGEDTYILRLTSKLVDLRMWYAKRIRRARLAEPHLAKLRKYDARCALQQNMYSCITKGYFAFGEDTYILRLTSKLVNLRMWYAKRIRRARLAEPHLAKLRKYDARCALQQNMYSCITEGYFAFGEDTYILRPTSKLVDLRMWYAKRIRRARLAEPHLAKLRKYDARCASYLRRDIEVVITRRS